MEGHRRKPRAICKIRSLVVLRQVQQSVSPRANISFDVILYCSAGERSWALALLDVALRVFGLLYLLVHMFEYIEQYEESMVEN